MVRAALARLRGLQPYRGQSELVRDAEECLARMMAAQNIADSEHRQQPKTASLETDGA